MNEYWHFKQLLILAKSTRQTGFTLIELLIVVLILAILAALGIPNLLGQVGRARETEAINTVGSINRAQQALYSEQGNFFATNNENQLVNVLGISLDLRFYSVPGDGNGSIMGEGAEAGKVAVNPLEPAVDNVRPFGGAIAFNTDTRIFSTVVCRDNDTSVNASLNDLTQMTGGAGSGTEANCGSLENI